MRKDGEYKPLRSPCASCGRPSSTLVSGRAVCRGCALAEQARKTASSPNETLEQAAERMGDSVERLVNLHSD